MWTRVELKNKAKEDLKAGYWALVVMALVLQFLSGGTGGGGSSASSASGEEFSEAFRSMDSSETFATMMIILGIVGSIVLIAIIFGILLSCFVYNPLIVGAQRYFITAIHKDATFSDYNCLGHAFKKGNYLNTVKIMFLRGLFTGLWSLLFIIPGIIKKYEYRMIPYILAENPTLTTEEAFRFSKEMMDGNKWNAFVLDLSFIGWYMLSLCTCGILSIFYVNPYVYLTDAHLYEALKHRASADYYDDTISQNEYTVPAPEEKIYGNPGAYSETYTLPDDIE